MPQLLDALILITMAVAGYQGAPWLLVLPGAVALTAQAWWRRIRLLRHEPSVPLSSKKTTYFVASIITNFGFSALSFLAGRALKVFWPI